MIITPPPRPHTEPRLPAVRVPFVPLRCPTHQHATLRIVPDGLTWKCKHCGQIERVSRAELEAAWATLAASVVE